MITKQDKYQQIRGGLTFPRSGLAWKRPPAPLSAHFPKFVHHFSNHLLRTSESGTSKFRILVSLFDLKSLGSFRRLRCRDFKSTALEAPNRPAPSRFEITKAGVTTPDQTQSRGSAPAVHYGRKYPR